MYKLYTSPQGHPNPMVHRLSDRPIAAFGMGRGHRLLQSDRDFDPIMEYLGLQIV